MEQFFFKWPPTAILEVRFGPFWMTENHKMAISNYYYLFIFIIWLSVAILDDRKSLSIAFLAISDQYATFIFIFFIFSQNGCRRPFWMTENHFRSHFSPFQINAQLFFFFTKWLPVAILDDRKSLSIVFLAISDQYATFFFLTKWRPAAILEVRFGPFWMIKNHFRSHCF